MKPRSFFLLPTGAAAAAATIMLAGCSAATNAINASIPPVSNLLSLDGQTTTATVNGSRAAISGNGTTQVQFPDRSLSQADKLKFVKFTQSLDRTVTVTTSGGAVLPATFSLSNIALTLSVSDAAPRGVSVSGTVAGPVTFTRVGATNQYQAPSGNITFSDVQIDGGNFGTFRDIVTTAPSPNTASGKIAFDTNTDQLPSGSQISFTFTDGTAKIGI